MQESSACSEPVHGFTSAFLTSPKFFRISAAQVYISIYIYMYISGFLLSKGFYKGIYRVPVKGSIRVPLRKGPCLKNRVRTVSMR